MDDENTPLTSFVSQLYFYQIHQHLLKMQMQAVSQKFLAHIYIYKYIYIKYGLNLSLVFATFGFTLNGIFTHLG